MELREDGCLHEQIGEYHVISPPVPPRSKFLNADVKSKKNQRWELPYKPTDKEYAAWQTDKKKEFWSQEMNRRINGVFFLNNGDVTWITGLHYFYLTCYHLDSGLPKFRESDRKFFWLWWDCCNDPKCEGLFFIDRRRGGKSFRGGVIGLEGAMRMKNVHIGMQSKTDVDAKKLFKRSFASPWKKIPAYFQVKYNGTNNPQSELRFEAPTISGRASRKEGGGAYQEAELGSWIDFENSKEEAYDGEKLWYFLNDEILKKQMYDPVERWSVVRKMMQEEGEVIGMSLHTSSVGQDISDENIKKAKDFWSDCDPRKLDGNGQTISGLRRYMNPAYEGFKVDEYGRSKIEESKAFFLARRQNFIDKRDNKGLLGEQRANPFTIEEAFQPSGTKTIYDPIILAETIREIDSYKERTGELPYKKYRLKFADQERVRVIAEPFGEGDKEEMFRFEFSWMPPDSSMLNRVRYDGDIVTSYGLQKRLVPLNSVNFGIGCDPIDKRRVTDSKKASNFSAHAFWKYDENNEANKNTPDYWPSGSFICRYSHRLANNETMYEDMRMLCIFLGCEMLFENQKCKIEDYFVNMGCEAFLAKRPDFTQTAASSKQEAPGCPSSPQVIGKYVELTEDFISGRYKGDNTSLEADWRRYPFPVGLDQWMHFDPENTKEFDEAVSAGFTLMHANRYIPKVAPAEEVENFRFSYY